MTVIATIQIPNRNIDDARNTEGIPVENQEKKKKKSKHSKYNTPPKGNSSNNTSSHGFT